MSLNTINPKDQRGSHQILIARCSHTSNLTAMLLITQYIKEKEHQVPYQHTRTIVFGENSYLIEETPMDLENPSCNCEFSVTNITNTKA